MSSPLIRKLGLRAGMRVCVVGAPPHYRALLGPLPGGLHWHDAPAPGLDFLHFFAPDRATLDAAFPALRAALAPDGLLWISWPKKTSPLATDLDGNGVRAAGLTHGLVDVKVCAVDADWSALKFVYRLADRPAGHRARRRPQ